MIRQQTTPQHIARRARIILMANGGDNTNQEIANRLGIRNTEVTRWTQRWIDRALESVEDRLADLPRSGRPDTISVNIAKSLLWPRFPGAHPPSGAGAAIHRPIAGRCTACAAGEEDILAADDEGSDRVLGDVIVDLDVPVVEKGVQLRPQLEGVMRIGCMLPRLALWFLKCRKAIHDVNERTPA